VQDINGYTALMHLVENIHVNYNNVKDIEFVKRFIENNTSIDLQNKKGFTAIMIAAQKCKDNLEIFCCLLDNTANLDLKNENGLSVLYFAQKNNNMKNFIQARKNFIEAKKDFATNRFVKAIKKLSVAIVLHDKNAIYYFKRSECYAKLLMWIEALADAKKSLELDDSFNEAYVQTAISLKNLNNIDSAIAILKSGINIDLTPNPFENEKNLKMLTLLEEFENELIIKNIVKNEKKKRKIEIIEKLEQLKNENESLKKEVFEIKNLLNENQKKI
jgi:tetratricopeptide (TPR) repeat protein